MDRVVFLSETLEDGNPTYKYINTQWEGTSDAPC
jgi:hypothetical protein